MHLLWCLDEVAVGEAVGSADEERLLIRVLVVVLQLILKTFELIHNLCLPKRFRGMRGRQHFSRIAAIKLNKEKLLILYQ